MRNEITIKATPNYKNRTFTIRKQRGGKTFVKYRTDRLEPEQFRACEFFTHGDWGSFLKYGSYYLVK